MRWCNQRESCYQVGGCAVVATKMPLTSCCSNSMLLTALAAIILLPAHYYIPNLSSNDLSPPVIHKIETFAQVPTKKEPIPWSKLKWLKSNLPALEAMYFPTLDLIFTISLVVLGLCTYLCEWVQWKLMQRRTMKLNQYLEASVAKLRAWDEQQEQLESTLRMVQTATSEYNLLLYLLLRQHGCLPSRLNPQDLDKDLDSDLSFPIGDA